MAKKEKNLLKTDDLMEELINDKESLNLPKVGDLIKAKVVSVGKSEVYLDYEGVAAGIVRARELVDESGRLADLKIGDEVTATVVETENEKGILELSFRSAGHQQAWEELETIKNEGSVVEIKITEANKGGLMASYNNMAGFLPVSQLNKEHYPRVEGGNKAKILEKLRELVNKKIQAKIIDLSERENKIIFSEKEVYAENRKEELKRFQIGEVVEGRVTGIVDFGVFMEFGEGLEGLIHISELAWQRISHPRDLYKVGDTIKAQIIGLDENRVTLSAKKLLEDPWKKAVEKYQVGQTVRGRVLKLDKFGAFVELEENIQGLMHVSEIDGQDNDKLEERLKVDESYDFNILSIDPEEHRLGLTLKKN
ncbi:MAG TPA: S1 RNA-binding domain-containing protein [bacterium]|nr:S1 RNA-binding domain-containing protein [bacterium]HPL95600.1 S1 RNA-binding domain-containing protein [bacterium]